MRQQRSRLRSVIVLSLLMSSTCWCRQPMLRESDEADSAAFEPAMALPLLRSISPISSGPESSPHWVQMDAAATSESEGTSTSTPSPSPLEQPDSTGLIGGLLDGRHMLSLNLWANQRRSQLKPRRRDMHEASLMKLLGSDYQPGWMRRSRDAANQDFPPEERPAVRALRQLVKNESVLMDLGLPTSLSPEAREIVASWLVKRATCPVRFVWADLGPFFWPRWLRRGECGRSGGDVDDDVIDSGRGRSGSPGEDDEDDDDDDYVDALGASLRRNVTDTARSCSWPPGMKCVPGVARTLHLLRWHCRLRKHRNTSYNTILNGPLSSGKHVGRPGTKPKANRRQKRSKYRCAWIKVPYSVPEDCVCSI